MRPSSSRRRTTLRAGKPYTRDVTFLAGERLTELGTGNWRTHAKPVFFWYPDCRDAAHRTRGLPCTRRNGKEALGRARQMTMHRGRHVARRLALGFEIGRFGATNGFCERMEPRAGIEPATCRLRIGCSTS